MSHARNRLIVLCGWRQGVTAVAVLHGISIGQMRHAARQVTWRSAGTRRPVTALALHL